jgi:hypothetical protein
MDEKQALIRHFLATIAYRTQKAIRGAPMDFGTFQAGSDVRTPQQLLQHMTLVLWYARRFFGATVPQALDTLSWEREITRFHDTLALLDADLAQGKPLQPDLTFEKLL